MDRHRHRTHRTVHLAGALAVVLLVGGCAARDDTALVRVRVTASGAAVLKCEVVGPVLRDSMELSVDTGIEQMQRATARRGGNTLYVTTYSGATSGTAYTCHPPLDPRDPRVMPSAGDRALP